MTGLLVLCVPLHAGTVGICQLYPLGVFLVFNVMLGSSPGLFVCEAGTLPTELHFQASGGFTV